MPLIERSIMSLSVLEMVEELRSLLQDRASLPCVNIGPTPEWPSPSLQERKVAFSGALQGCLLLRAPERIQDLLGRSLDLEGRDPALPAASDAFRELTSLYFDRLLPYLWKGPSSALKIFRVRGSHPSPWPAGSPLFSFTALVGDLPLEVRLWLKEAGA